MSIASLGDDTRTIADEMEQVHLQCLHRIHVRDKKGELSKAVLEIRYRRHVVPIHPNRLFKEDYVALRWPMPHKQLSLEPFDRVLICRLTCQIVHLYWVRAQIVKLRSIMRPIRILIICVADHVLGAAFAKVVLSKNRSIVQMGIRPPYQIGETLTIGWA